MDFALKPTSKEDIEKLCKGVSILVLMDFALKQQCRGHPFPTQRVSILVLMDFALKR